MNYRNECWNLLNKFDNAIGKIKWAGKEYYSLRTHTFSRSQQKQCIKSV